MTGGRVIVLGKVGNNFAAGMSGGIAYLLDDGTGVENRINPELVEVEKVTDEEELQWLEETIATHKELTGSTVEVNPAPHQGHATRLCPRAGHHRASRSRRLRPRRHRRCHHGGSEVMADPQGFLKYRREGAATRPVPLRLLDWNEVYEEFSDEKVQTQARRCMDCGIPFCHDGCPLGNIIPEWNDLVRKVAGAKPTIACTPPITSRSSLAGCAQPRAKALVCWVSAMIQ